MPQRELVVRADWDEEAGVWVASSDHVPGLVTEAETLEELVDHCAALIPHLLELNAPERLTPDIRFRIEARRTVHGRVLAGRAFA